MENKFKILDLCKMAMLLAILIVCSFIKFSIGPIPITMQTFAVFAVAYFLDLKGSCIVIATYILMGLLGLPVFSGGQSGFASVLMPSFGFIIGFLVAQPIINFKRSKKALWLIFRGFIALVVIYIFGASYMAFIINGLNNGGKSLLAILNLAVFPFMIKDSLSVLLAYLVYYRLRKTDELPDTNNILA